MICSVKFLLKTISFLWLRFIIDSVSIEFVCKIALIEENITEVDSKAPSLLFHDPLMISHERLERLFINEGGGGVVCCWSRDTTTTTKIQGYLGCL